MRPDVEFLLAALCGRAPGMRAGWHYVDTGTLNGYRSAIRLLAGEHEHAASIPQQETISNYEFSIADHH
jgi:hypothetical protein